MKSCFEFFIDWTCYYLPTMAFIADTIPVETKKPSWLTDAFLRNNPRGKFPSESTCHYLGIRKEPTESEKTPQSILCKVHRQVKFKIIFTFEFVLVLGF